MIYRNLIVILVLFTLLINTVHGQEGRDQTPLVPRKISNFYDWSIGKGIDVSKLTIKATEVKGYGVFTKSPVSKGSILLTLPPQARFRVPNLDPQFREMINVFNEASATKIDPTTALALGLLYEKGQQSGSEWDRWIETFPTKLDSVLFWEREELKMLAKTPLIALREELLENIYTVYTKVVSPFVESFEAELVGLDFTLDAFRQAAVLVQTRALHRSQKNGLSLLPFIDFINHDSEPNAVVIASGKDILLKATRSLTAGSEILISYGENPSHVMMLLYGFTDLHSKIDYFPIRVVIKAKDIDLPRRKLLLRRRGLGNEDHEYRIYYTGDIIDDDLMYAIRVVVADDKELTILEQRSSKLEDGEVDDSIVSAKNEANALNKLKVMLYDLSNFEEGWEKELDSLAEQLQYSFRAKHGVIYNWKSRAILAEALRYVDSLESGTPQKPKSDLYYKEEKPHAMEFADLQEGDSYEDDNNEF